MNRHEQARLWVHVQVKHCWVVCLCGMLLVFGPSCSGELDPKSPEDAYLMFRDALFLANTEAVWGRLDASTHAYFQKSHETLLSMNETIEKFLPQADHRLARKQSGVILTQHASDGKSLFLHLFKPGSLPQDDAHTLGSEVDEVKLDEQELVAQLSTRGGQSFFLVREDTESEWFVVLLKSTDALATSMGWLKENKLALDQTVDDLLAEQQKERETIIAELMNL